MTWAYCSNKLTPYVFINLKFMPTRTIELPAGEKNTIHTWSNLEANRPWAKMTTEKLGESVLELPQGVSVEELQFEFRKLMQELGWEFKGEVFDNYCNSVVREISPEIIDVVRTAGDGVRMILEWCQHHTDHSGHDKSERDDMARGCMSLSADEETLIKTELERVAGQISMVKKLQDYLVSLELDETTVESKKGKVLQQNGLDEETVIRKRGEVLRRERLDPEFIQAERARATAAFESAWKSRL